MTQPRRRKAATTPLTPVSARFSFGLAKRADAEVAWIVLAHGAQKAWIRRCLPARVKACILRADPRSQPRGHARSLSTKQCLQRVSVDSARRAIGHDLRQSRSALAAFPRGLTCIACACHRCAAMKASAAFGAVLYALVSSAHGMSWSTCGDGPFTTSTVELTPDPPRVGSDVDFSIQGTYDPEGARVAAPGVLGARSPVHRDCTHFVSSARRFLSHTADRRVHA